MDAIEKIIRDSQLCSLATTNGETPHCSLMNYYPDESLRKIYLLTRPDSVKFNNIQKCPAVSVLFDNRARMGQDQSKGMALSVLGHARIIEDQDQARKLKDKLSSSSPYLEQLIIEDACRVIEVAFQNVIVAKGPTSSRFQDWVEE